MTTKTKTTAPAGDPRVEGMLDRLGVPWTLELISLEEINERTSRQNQARTFGDGAALDADTVERYTLDMKAGAEFPPVLARRTSAKAKLVLLGGNHRHAAAVAAGRAVIPGYVVEVADEALVVRLMYEDNRTHGLAVPREDRLRQAVHLTSMGWTNRDAGACVGIEDTAVATAKSVFAASGRARKAGVGDEFDGLTWTHRARLAGLNTPVLVEATKVVAASGMTQVSTTEFCRRLKAAGSDEAALRLVGDELEARRGEWQERAGAGGRKRGGNRPDARVRGAMVTIMSEDVAGVVASCPNDRARRDLVEKVRRLGAWCGDLLEELR